MTRPNQPVILAAGGHDYGLDDFYSKSGELSKNYKRVVSACKTGDWFDIDLHQLYCNDIIAKKIIDIPVFDALSNWRETPAGMAEIEKEFSIPELMRKATRYARLHGFVLIMPLLKYRDTQRQIAPSVRLERVMANPRPIELAGIVILHKNIEQGDLEEDICSENYDLPKDYRVGDLKIHHSRIIRMGGECPFFNALSYPLHDFHEMFARLYEAVRRNGAFVYKADFEKIMPYVEALQKTTGDDAKTLLQAIADLKAQTAKKNLAENNVLIIGQDEEIERFEAQNIDDLVQATEQQMKLLAGIADIPVSRLFGLIQSSLGNNADRGLENYSQALDTMLSEFVDPSLKALDKFIGLVRNITVSDEYVWNPTRAEELILSRREVENSVTVADD